MKNNRMAQALRALSVNPSLESSDANDQGSTVETGPSGDGVIKTDVKPAQDVQADGAGAPGEDKNLVAKTVTEDKGPKEESAATTSDGASTVVTSQESNDQGDQGSSVTTGDGDVVSKANVDPAQDVQADGAGAPGEDKEVTAKIVEVGERSDLETAETTSADSNVSQESVTVVSFESDGQVTISQEGLKGAVKGFAIGTAGVLLSPLTLGLSNGALDAMQKQKREKLANEINVLAKRLADLKNGDVEQAKKEGIRVPQEQIDKVDAGTVVKSFILGTVLPFYSTYQGHKVEELEIELAAKVAALKIEMARHGIATESLVGDDDAAGQANAVSTESLTLAALGFVGLSAAFSAWFSSKEQDALEEMEKLAKQVGAKRAELKAAEEEFKRRANAAIEKAKQQGKVGTANAVSQEGVAGAIGGALYTGLTAFLWGPLVGSLVSMGLWGASWATAVKQLKSLQKELDELELKLADRQLDLATRVADAEKKYKVSNESIDDAVANAAVSAAAAVAEGAAAAAEAAAAAVDAATDTPEEVVANAQERAENASNDVHEAVDDLSANDGNEELEELEEAIDAGESHAATYENEAATLESLIDILKDAQHTGGLTPQAASLFKISFESMGVRLTGSPFKNSRGEEVVPSLESFGGTGRRIDATQISMEAAQDVLKKVIEVLKATWAQIKQWMIKFFQAAFNQAARLKQRAEKITAAAKQTKNQPKSGDIKLGSLADKIAIGTNISLDNVAVLEVVVKEAVTRAGEGKQGFAKIRSGLARIGATASYQEIVDTFKITHGTMELRSAAFKNQLTHDGKEGYATDVLPGNFKLFTYHPLLNTKQDPTNLTEAAKLALASYQMTHGFPVDRIDIESASNAEATIKTPSLNQIIGMVDRVKKIIEAFENTKQDLDAETFELGTVSISDRFDETQAANIKGIVTEVTRAARSASNSQAKLAKAVITTCGHFLDAAALALKEYDAVAQDTGNKATAATPA